MSPPHVADAVRARLLEAGCQGPRAHRGLSAEGAHGGWITGRARRSAFGGAYFTLMISTSVCGRPWSSPISPTGVQMFFSMSKDFVVPATVMFTSVS